VYEHGRGERASTEPFPPRAYELAHKLALSVLSEAEARQQPKIKREPYEKVRAQRLAAAELPSLMLFAGVLVRAYPAQRERFGAQQSDQPTPIAAAGLLKELEEKPTGPPRTEFAFDVVERYVCMQPSLTTRTHYNLACFYAGIAKHDRALRELDLALVDAGLLPWAHEDPSLEPLRKEVPKPWTEVIDRHEPAPPGKKADPPTPAQAQAAAAVAEFGKPGDVRRRTDVDFEVVTEKGVVLVDFKSGAAASEAAVEALAGARALRRRARTRVAGLVLVVGTGTQISPKVLEAARQLDVRLLEQVDWRLVGLLD